MLLSISQFRGAMPALLVCLGMSCAKPAGEVTPPGEKTPQREKASPEARVSSGKKISLAPRFKAGDHCYIQMEQDIQRVVVQEGRTDRSGSKMLRGVLQKVVSVTPKGAELELVFDRAMQSIESSMITTSYDSDLGDDPKASPIFKQLLKPILAQSMHLKLDEHMRPTSLRGMTQISKKVASDAETSGNPFWGQMRQEYTDERALFTWGDSLFQLYPDHPVEVGEKWTRDVSDDLQQSYGILHYHYECKLDRVIDESGGKVASVSFKGTIGRTPTSQPTIGGPAINSIDGSFEGIATIDLSRGCMTHRAEKRKSKTQLSVPPRGQRPAQSIELNVDLDQRIKVLTPDERAREKMAAQARQDEERRKREAAAATQPAGASKSPASQPAQEE